MTAPVHKCGHAAAMRESWSQDEFVAALNSLCPECEKYRLENRIITHSCGHQWMPSIPITKDQEERLASKPCVRCRYPNRNEDEEGHKDDSGKLRYDLIPPEALEALARVLTYGARKYAPDNWKNVPDGKARYYAALMRHFEAWRKCERNDPESGLPHLAHAMACVTFLVFLEADHE